MPGEPTPLSRSTYTVPAMDCPAEERLVRLALDDVAAVRSLTFDLPRRKVAVLHVGTPAPITERIVGLGLGGILDASEAATAAPVDEGAEERERRVLIWVLVINATFFVGELAAGLLGESLGLVADSLDMLADAAVYGLSLAAIGKSAARKAGIARASGYGQLALAAFGLVEVVRRTLAPADAPDFAVMMAVGAAALVANAVCLYLLHRVRSPEAHLQASYIFTANDIVINAGVILAGGLVLWTRTRWPDLVIGAIVFLIVCRGAVRILRLAR